MNKHLLSKKNNQIITLVLIFKVGDKDVSFPHTPELKFGMGLYESQQFEGNVECSTCVNEDN